MLNGAIALGLSFATLSLAYDHPCPEELSIPLIGMKTPDGFVTPEENIYKEGSFWLKNGVYFGCPCIIESIGCFRKCCPFGERLQYNGKAGMPTCEADATFADQPLTFTIKTENDTINVIDIKDVPNPLFVGNKFCTQSILMNPEINYIFYHDGSMDYGAGLDEYFQPGEACIEHEKNNISNTLVLGCPSIRNWSLKIEEEEKIKFMVYPIMMLISCVFLAVTILAYMLVPEMRNLHGRCMVSHSASLLVCFLSLSLLQLGSTHLHASLCITFAFVVQFTLLSAFTWMNVMCFDMWWTFSGHRLMASENQGSLTNTKKFLLQCAYAWGTPFLIFLVTLVLQFSPDVPKYLITPGFGEMRCGFRDQYSSFAFLYGPITVFLAANVYFFVSSTLKIIQMKRETAMLKSEGCQKHNDNTENSLIRFNLYFKMFLLMGLTWIMEVVSWILPLSSYTYIWFFTDIVNIFQGFFIFLICLWTTKFRQPFLNQVCPDMACLAFKNQARGVTSTITNSSAL